MVFACPEHDFEHVAAEETGAAMNAEAEASGADTPASRADRAWPSSIPWSAVGPMSGLADKAASDEQ